MKRLGLCLLAAAPLFAQIGPFPGGGYPRGPGYPQGGPGIPWPRRGKQGGQNKDATPVVKQSGKIRKIDDKSLVVEAPDARVITFQRTAKTVFYGTGSDRLDPAKLKPGDKVSVEATQDQEGNLSAQSVRLEKAAAAGSAGSGTEQPEAAGSAPSNSRDEPEARMAPPPAPRDADDPGPPELRHGAAPRRSTSSDRGDTVESAAARERPAPPAPAAKPAPAPEAESTGDPVLAKARTAAGQFEESLPDYVCQEYMARFASGSRPSDFEPLDVVSAEVVYQSGHESYRNVAVNGRAANKDIDQIKGSWSKGEFASTLLDLFSRGTDAEFHLRGESRASGMPARVYDFTVEQPHSHWQVQASAQLFRPAYRGSVWIEPRTGHVLRIEMQARALPEEFPLDTVETAVDYANVRIGDGEFLLPTHAENLACERGEKVCSKNAIDFRNYRKYDAKSNITF